MDELTGDSPTIASDLAGVAPVVAGRYRVRRRLGRGASKDVYLAHDERLDRDVALAIVYGAGSSAVARARVAREAQVTGRLGDHPNVITVWDAGELEGIPYLVLRAMPGGSLADLLARERPSFERTIRLGRDIAAALAHAHAHDVVHRDVKPDNVWLADRESSRAALGDFGIAHQRGSERLTAEGMVVGTFRYLSPEQARGEEAGPESDLYALGVTLYELVTGRVPFTADTPPQLLAEHLYAEPPAPSQIEPDVPEPLERLILDLLVKDRALRPASAAGVEAALAAIDPAADPPPAGATRSPSAHPAAQRVVTVLAARVGDEDGDPEALHGLFERCAAVIESHGGSVEQQLGDALVGVFGLQSSHGDDALRAARAAVQLRTLDGSLRLGLQAGAVFLAGGSRGTSITGAAIREAQRLAEDAALGEIRIGDDVRAAIGPDAHLDSAGELLLELDREQPALLRAPATPFVGRAGELTQLRDALARVVRERGCRMVTVSGPPGIGKSRLAGEFLAGVGDSATVLAGRCLAYGEGTTYRALAEIVRALGEDPGQRVEELLDGDELAVRAILGAIGLLDEPAQADETAWALRRLLERVAAERPLVVAVEDIHWADPVLLDLLDHLVALSSGAPILLVCLTRPELLETRPAWNAPQPNRSLVVLDALADADARELAAALGAGELASRIARRAEGNPLFVEQLVAVDAGQDTVELPASIQAVLAARIDRLEDGERTVLQRAAIEGRTFHAGALAILLPEAERRATPARLVALSRKGLIAADRPVHAGEDAFRFTHALIREAAVAGVPKLLRADLHTRLARWLQARPAAADEIVGFHLEQAHRLAIELGRDGEPERTLAVEAAQRLERAASSAQRQGHADRAAGLLERAIALPQADPAARGALLPALGGALYDAGRLTDAVRVFDEAVTESPDAALRARAQIDRELVRLESETSQGTRPGLQVTRLVLPVLEQAGDVRGQCRAWSLRARISFIAGRVAEADEAWATAAALARRAQDERELFDALAWRATASLYGPMPVHEAIASCQEHRQVVAGRPLMLACILNPLAVLHAMDGAFDDAERCLGQADRILEELGGLRAHVPHYAALVELLAGQPARAEAALRAKLAPLESLNISGTLVTTMALLAQAVLAQGRVEEAGELARRTADATAADDVLTQAIWRGVRARVLADAGRGEEAEALAREAVALTAPTDLLSLKADAMLALADVLRTRAQAVGAEQAALEGIALHDQKGNAAAAATARALLYDHEGNPPDASPASIHQPHAERRRTDGEG